MKSIHNMRSASRARTFLASSLIASFVLALSAFGATVPCTLSLSIHNPGTCDQAVRLHLATNNVDTGIEIQNMIISPGGTWNYSQAYSAPAGDNVEWMVWNNPVNVLYFGPEDSINGTLGTSNQCTSVASELVTPIRDQDDADDDCDQENCSGLARWHVSESFVSLWLHDEPLGYQGAIGPRTSFQLDFKQREVEAGYYTNLFSVGKKWNFSWLSYIYTNAGKSAVYCPDGGRFVDDGYGNPDYRTRAILSGNAGSAYTLTYPDGRQYIYGFMVYNGSQLMAAMLSEQRDAEGRGTHLYYYPVDPSTRVIRLHYVVDADSRTNTIYYVSANNYSTNLISSVVDPFGRTTTLSYDDGGHLMSITDVAGNSSSFTYSGDIVNSMTTPYGTTLFAVTDADNPVGSASGRSVLITEPDGGHQLYLFKDYAPGVADSYSTDLPSTSPLSNTLENSELSTRNTFHWGARQYARLSTTDVASFSASDFRLARMRHWLYYWAGICGDTLSMERQPSPDPAGGTEGEKTWFDYENKLGPTGVSWSKYQGQQASPMFKALQLPDGTTRFSKWLRNSLGAATNQIETYSSSGGVALRTNTFVYAANGIDLVVATNALGIQVASNSYNAYHQVLTHFNALAEKTTFTYNSIHQLTSVKWPSGLTTTNLYFTSGPGSNWLSQTIDLEVGRTNSFSYTNDLLLTLTNPLGLVLTFTWDALSRVRRVDYSDATFITNTYDKLDLVRMVDRMGFINSYGFDPMRRLTNWSNPLGFSTIYNYCNCGALDSIQDQMGNLTHYFYDNQGRRTNSVLADGYSITNRFNLVGQLTNVTDSGGASTTNWFNNQGLLVTVSNAAGQISSTTFDALDRPLQITDANGVTQTNAFDPLSRLLSRSWPSGGGAEGFLWSTNGLLAYTNQDNKLTWFLRDAASRLLAMTNANQEVVWLGYNGLGGVSDLWDGNSNHTAWHFYATGLVSNKVDALGREVFHVIRDPNGQVTNRYTPQYGNTSYLTDPAGNVTNILYSSSTPSVALAFDPLNRLTNMIDAVGVTRFTWTATSQLQTEIGPWTSSTASNSYSQGLRTAFSLNNAQTAPFALNYSYDSGRRMAGITTPAGPFGYGYGAASAASALVKTISLPNAAYVTNHYDGLGRLDFTALANYWGHVLDGYTYTHDPLGLRTNILRNFGLTNNSVAVGYDNIGQVTSWLGKEASSTPRLNEQLGFAYDPADNLRFRTNGGLIQTFNNDAANELTNILRTGLLTVSGSTPAPATNITVNGQLAQTYSDLTFAGANGFTLANGTNNFTIIAQNAYGVTVTNAVVSTLPASVTLAFDLNGNLTNDGSRSFFYDAENELTNVQVTGQWKSEFVFDGLGRRRIERNYAWQANAWVKTNEVRLIYDCLLPVQERDGSNNVLVTYARGLDLSGTISGAGGIGGLVARIDASSTNYYHSDGAGNVTTLMDGFQNISGRYLYGPFGKLIGTWGPTATANSIDHSSMPRHTNSGLNLYPFRAYDPGLQRWINRDPIGEAGGVNLYGYVGNNPIGFFDLLGLATYPEGFIGPLQIGDLLAGRGDPMRLGSDGLFHPTDGGVTDLSMDYWDMFNFGRSITCSAKDLLQPAVCWGRQKLKDKIAPKMKDSPFGPKIGDPVPKDGVPKNWTKEQVADAITDYQTSIASRKAEQAAFDSIGGGAATERLAHARRITEEENFLNSLFKAQENRR
jgi:RHS repeat-associated protein